MKNPFCNAFGSTGGSFDPAAPGPIGGTTPNTGAFTALSITQGTLTNPATGLSLTATWNDAADTFRGVDITITSTAAASSSTPFRATINGLGFSLRDDGTWGSVDGVGVIRPSFAWVIENGSIADFQANLRIGGTWSGIRMAMLSASHGLQMGANLDAIDLVLRREAAATLQLGITHATTPTAQTIKAHDVTTGTGADLTLKGGTGSSANGRVLIVGIPTSSAGLPSGTLWNDGGVIKVA
jgi:hypothetical protein